jgi:hypothetical protein
VTLIRGFGAIYCAFFRLVLFLDDLACIFAQVRRPVKSRDEPLQLMPLHCHVIGPAIMKGTLFILGEERLSPRLHVERDAGDAATVPTRGRVSLGKRQSLIHQSRISLRF